MKSKKILSVLLILFFAFGIFYSCGKKDGDKTSDKKRKLDDIGELDTNGAINGDWVIKREMSDAEKLNPIVTNDNTAEGVYLRIYEALLDQNFITFEFIPELASLPEVAPDYLSYTFKMNKDAKFSDGKPVTGEDVIYTMKAIKNPFADNAAARNYYESVKSVELVNGDLGIVRINMKEPSWRAIINLGSFAICPKHVLDPENLTDKYTWDDCKDYKTAEKNPAIKKYADFLNSQEVSREPKYVLGSGPYMLEKWETGQNIILKRSPNYWDRKNTPNYPDKIIFKIIQDNSASVVAAKNKEIDLMVVVSPKDFYKELENAEQFDLVRVTPSEPAFSYIGWNMKNPLFSDKKVRWALSHLVDRNSIIEKVLYGSATKIQSPVYYKFEKLLNKELPEIPFDPEKAKKLLDEAGWKDTDGNGILDKMVDGKKLEFKFTFLIPTHPVRKQTLLVIADALKKVGIQAEVQELEWSVYLDKTKKHQFDATLAAWANPTTPPDPYQIYHSSQMEGEGSNYVSYNNPESDKLIEEYRRELDENKRIDILKRWQQIIYDDQVYTFLWNPKSRYIYNNRYRNTRFYSKRNSMEMNEWWVPKGSQKYSPTMN